MKLILLTLCTVFFLTSTQAQQTAARLSVVDSTKKIMNVEASCGECQFRMAGKGCHLAIRFNDKTYFVDGTSLDDHGDAHASDGFCESIKKARVQGEVINDRFKVTYFKLAPKEEATKPKSKR